LSQIDKFILPEHILELQFTEQTCGALWFTSVL